MKFETLVYVGAYQQEENNIDKIASLSGSIELRDTEHREELWVKVNHAIVNYFLTKKYITKQEAKEIVQKADVIVLF